MALTAERVRELFDYDPATGWFTRKVAVSCEKAGAVAGCLNTNARLGYWVISIDGKRYYSHRLAWLHTHGRWPSEIDHINGIRDDNRLVNLREVTRAENMHNARRTAAHLKGLRGANYRPDLGKWSSRLKQNGKRYNLGFYQTKEEAHAAYVEAAKRLRGVFIRLD